MGAEHQDLVGVHGAELRGLDVGDDALAEALLRLVGALLAEQDDEWQEGRRYMSRESLDALTKTGTPEGPALEHDAAMALDAAA